LHRAPFSMWRVVSTNPRLYSPCHCDTRLLVITYSYSRISDYNPYLIYILFFEISLNLHFCISLFRNMRHVYSPQYGGPWWLVLVPFINPIVLGKVLYQYILQIKPRISLISWKNHSFITLTENSRATPVLIKKYNFSIFILK